MALAYFFSLGLDFELWIRFRNLNSIMGSGLNFRTWVPIWALRSIRGFRLTIGAF